jgi:hypothetical protein
MPSKGSILGVGFLGLAAIFGISVIEHEPKPYFSGEYYYSDNTTYLDYRTLWKEQNAVLPEGYVISNTPPKFEGPPVALPSVNPMGNKFSFFQNGESVDFAEILNETEYRFSFNQPVKVYVPFDCNVTNISPNTKSGLIPGFDGYFSGKGVTVETVGFVSGSDMDIGSEYEVRITYSNLSRTWQSIGHDVSCKDTKNNRELFYTNFIPGGNYNFRPGQYIGITGRTGSIPRDEEFTDYVTIRLEKRKANTQAWIGMTFGEFFNLR